MDTTLLRHFVAAAEKLDFTRAAKSLKISRTALSASIQTIEAEVGYALFDRAESGVRLTEVGTVLLADARLELAESANATRAPVVPAGGKAKAAKGQGRAPAVKGQSRPGKRRQSR